MALPSAKDVLTYGGLDESIKKLVQPAGVVPAAVFLGLNLIFVYPILLKLEVGAAVQYEALREIAEQLRINELGGVQNLENIRNPIGAARKELLQTFQSLDEYLRYLDYHLGL